MVIYDKTNEKIEISTELDISYFVERYNSSLSYLFFDRVTVCSFKNIESFYEDDLISDELYDKALKDFEEKISKEDHFKDIKLCVFLNTEENQDIFIASNHAGANKIAAEKANELVTFVKDYKDFELDVIVYACVEDLMRDECDNSVIIDFLKYDFLFQKKPTQTQLAEYLGFTKGAVSQYDDIKKELMIKGLLFDKIVEDF